MKLNGSLGRLGCLALGLLLLPGCTTAFLWAKKPYQPASHPHLLVALQPGGSNLLVCYDETCGRATNVHRRAYWAGIQREKAVARSKPQFVKLRVGESLQPITVLPDTNRVPASGYCVVAAESGWSFDLFCNGESVGFYNLPVYQGAPPATWWRLGLTPVTVATDAAIVAAICMGQGAH